MENKNKFITKKDISKHYPISESFFNKLWSNREKNDLTRCVVKLHRKVIINSPLFDEWLAEYATNSSNKQLKDKTEKSIKT